MFAWTDDHIAELRRLAETKLSSSQIAALLGGGLSRNAVIGKLARLKIPLGGPRLNLSPRREPTPRPKPQSRAARIVALRAAPVPHVEPAPPTVIDAAALEPTVLFLNRTARQCAWPYGDPSADMMCCGRRVVPNSSDWPYCGSHLAKAAQVRRDARRAA